MNVYRILKNGERYRVQRQGRFGFWHTEGYGGGYGGFYPEEFSSHDAAQSYIDKQNQPQAVDNWVVW